MSNGSTNSTSIEILPRYQPSATAVSILNVTLFSTLIIVTAVWLCLRRQHPILRARNIYVSLFCLFFYFLVYTINSLFYAISPERGFPCWLHFASFAIGPLAVVGSIIKSWRLLFLMLLAKKKTELASEQCKNAQQVTRAIKVYSFLTSIPFLIVNLVLLAIFHTALIIINVTVLPHNYRCDIPNALLQNLLYVEAVLPTVLYCSVCMLSWQLLCSWQDCVIHGAFVVKSICHQYTGSLLLSCLV